MTYSLSEDVLNFWLTRVGPKGWYAGSPALDDAIRRRFGRAVQAARAGDFDNWVAAPRSSLALLMLLDQFSRNLYRGSGEAFAADPHARRIARLAVARSFDQWIDEPGRQFFFLPFMHSEAMADQNACVALIGARMPRTGRANMPFAREHREIIRRFGRFPHRNKALGRKTTPEEQEFLDNGGFSA
jgi:uncharacterized protein (DUF924 family)